MKRSEIRDRSVSTVAAPHSLHFMRAMDAAMNGDCGMKRREFLAGAMALAAGDARWAWAQDYPSKPVRIVVSTAAGGLADTLGRMLASHMTNTLGQQFY